MHSNACPLPLIPLPPKGAASLGGEGERGKGDKGDKGEGGYAAPSGKGKGIAHWLTLVSSKLTIYFPKDLQGLSYFLAFLKG